MWARKRCFLLAFKLTILKIKNNGLFDFIACRYKIYSNKNTDTGEIKVYSQIFQFKHIIDLVLFEVCDNA
jgi:hypothetical protein